MSVAAVSTSQSAWSRVLSDEESDHAQQRHALVAVVLERLERGFDNAAAITDDAGLSEEFDQWLERLGALDEVGRIAEPRLQLSTDPKNRRSERVWRLGEGFLYPEPQYIPVLQDVAGRRWLREELQSRLPVEGGRSGIEWLRDFWKVVESGGVEFTEGEIRERSGVDDARYLRALERRGLVIPVGNGLYRRQPGDLEAGEQILERFARPDYGFGAFAPLMKTQAEAVFRNRVLANFQGYCALCGLGMPGMVEVAHITPLAAAPERQLDPANGIALCATHRTAFEQELVGVDGRRLVLRTGVQGNGRAKPLWSLHGTRMRDPRLPIDERALREHADRVRRLADETS